MLWGGGWLVLAALFSQPEVKHPVILLWLFKPKQISTSMMNPPGIKHHILMLADSKQDKDRWVLALNELHKILKKNRISDTSVYRAKEIYDGQLPYIAKTTCATIMGRCWGRAWHLLAGKSLKWMASWLTMLVLLLADHDNLLVGSEEGLYILDLLKDSKHGALAAVAWRAACA